MDAISLEDDWELLPDHMSSSFMEECTSPGHGAAAAAAAGGGKGDQLFLFGAKLIMINTDHFIATATSHPSPCDCILDDEEAKKQLLPPSQDHAGVVHDPTIRFKDIDVSCAEEDEEKMIRSCSSDGAKEARDQDEVLVEAEHDLCGEEEEEEDAETGRRRGLDCTGFGVGKLRVNGVGALCSFGVAAATFCIFLLGGRQQNREHNHKIQLQMYADDEGIQQVVQQASRLNQAMSSVIGGSSTRASISFGGYYDGF